MSHYLDKVRIQNYRSIVDLELQLSPFAPLVGENNAGKSNILNAIQWLIKPDKLTPKHFNDLTSPVSVEAEVTGITEELLGNLNSTHATKLTPFVHDGTIRIKRAMAVPGAASTAKLEIFDPESGEFKVNPTGLPAAVSSLLPEPVRVEAMVDAPEDAAKNKASSTLGKLLSKLSYPLEEGQGSQLESLFGQVAEIFSAEGENRAPELNQFDEEATNAVQGFFPGINLSVHFPAPTLPDLFKNGTVQIKETGSDQNRDFGELGHGAQRSIQMALVQLLASRSQQGSETPRCTLLLIDEPELYLHPQAIEQVRLSFKRLSRAGYQVAFSTHSPLLIAREDLPAASIISKTNAEAGTTANPRVAEAVEAALSGDTVKQAQVLFELGNATEILFCQKVILVEGHTEPKIIPSLYQSVAGKSLKSDKTGIVQLSGSGDTQKAMSVLSTMGVTSRSLVDLDYAFKQGPKSGLIQADNPHLLSVKKWFEDNKDALSLVLSDDGFPTKRSEGGSEGAFEQMAADSANHEAINNLHDELKLMGVWLWKTGSIEKVIGLEAKNNPQVLAAKCLELESTGSSALANETECSAFCAWLQETTS